MNIFTYDKKIPFSLNGLSIAMGNFDGLHLGHKSIIDLARKNCLSKKFGILTFEPHPREFFAPNEEPFRLMTNATKEFKLESLGLDVLLKVQFTESISLLKPDEFVKKPF